MHLISVEGSPVWAQLRDNAGAFRTEHGVDPDYVELEASEYMVLCSELGCSKVNEYAGMKIRVKTRADQCRYVRS